MAQRRLNALNLVLVGLMPWIEKIRRRVAAMHIQTAYRRRLAAVAAKHRLAVMFICLRLQCRVRVKRARELLELTRLSLQTAERVVCVAFSSFLQ